jgi:hypothetical protein
MALAGMLPAGINIFSGASCTIRGAWVTGVPDTW